MQPFTPEEKNIACKALAAYAVRADGEDAIIAKRLYDRLSVGTTFGLVAEVIPRPPDKEKQFSACQNDQLPSIAPSESTTQD